MKQYEFRKAVKVRQLDGSYKRQNVFANSEQELTEKIKAKQEKAELEYLKTVNPTFSIVADEWNERHETEIEYNTWSSYQAPLNDVKKRFGDMLLEEIEAFDIQRFLNQMKDKGFKYQTINLRKIVINLVFNFAILQGYTRYNPCSVVKTPKTGRKKVELPTQEQVRYVNEHLDSNIGFLAYFIMFTGCRKGEALALKYEDIDFKNNTISVYKSVYHKNNIAYVKDTKTVNGVRHIPLFEHLKNNLDQNGKGYIFSIDGKIYTKSYVNKEWKKYLNSLGSSLTFHQLRHMFATFCYDAGLDEKDTQHIMGHSKIETTRNIYTHIRNERQKISTNKLNNFFASNF